MLPRVLPGFPSENIWDTPTELSGIPATVAFTAFERIRLRTGKKKIATEERLDGRRSVTTNRTSGKFDCANSSYPPYEIALQKTHRSPTEG
jgi:hypothetical protein